MNEEVRLGNEEKIRGLFVLQRGSSIVIRSSISLLPLGERFGTIYKMISLNTNPQLTNQAMHEDNASERVFVCVFLCVLVFCVYHGVCVF